MTPSFGSTFSESSSRQSAFSSSSSDVSSIHTFGPREKSPCKVLIVGAGVGGLMLAVCLERAGIDYIVLERTLQLPVPKTTIQLTANALRAIEQLGLLDEVLPIAKPVSRLTLMKHNMSVTGHIDATAYKERYGHYSCVVGRTQFCEILISNLTPGKVMWGKYVLEIVNGNAGVQVRCSNGYVEEADIIIGADGAYSAIRQNIYRAMKAKSLLPKSDMEPLKHTKNAIIGVTEPLDPLRFPAVVKRFSEVTVVVGKDPLYTMWLTPIADRRVAWSLSGDILKPEDDSNFKQSEFGPEVVDAVCGLIQDLEIPWGGTMADLIECTQRDHITKVMMEEKHYKTWHYGRAALIGEACHKFATFSGQGAEQAIMDAICIANLLYRLDDHPTHEDYLKVFGTYQRKRSPITRSAAQVSHSMSHLMNTQGLSADIQRKLLFSLPGWIKNAGSDKIQVRPLLDYLAPVEDRAKKSVKISNTM
ncbi:hypothetical protein BGX29_006379 [Mortierella sp. GBA35]|nr:hypothetical protein BGX23_004621 [Mortierella sp. AD031]KAF9100661.1 hypothetical protein BGX29_006379 [Mortierella sp. GBA35]KAG0216763.1 hypothetical protein BGX33_012182 [Mortierella sp. NVP41]